MPLQNFMRIAFSLTVILAAWQLLVSLTNVPDFILPEPSGVLRTLIANAGDIASHAGVTLSEIVLGMAIGVSAGAGAAIIMASSRRTARELLPLLVASQAIPVFAIAPILVLWLGYGMASKVAMAALIIFFPVSATLLQGLRRLDPALDELSRMMAQGMPGASMRRLVHVRLPAALPALGDGLRVAAAIAPIGAVLGEWVGASEGLGYAMMQANARVNTELMFACLIVLALMAVTLYFMIDVLMRRVTRWAYVGDVAR